MEVLKLARDLIKIPSPSGEEKEICNYLVKRLEKNFDVKIQKVGNRFNILAVKGYPKLILTTHMDTVPKQTSFNEDEIWIYGRGSCDAKGVIASMVCACEEALEKGIKDFGMLFDVGEETDFSGIKKAIDLVNPEIIIVGEPTSFKIVYGQKGLIQLKIRCKGKSAPGSTPEKGISAINILIEILKRLLSNDYPKDALLGDATLNIGKIAGGSAPNVVADYAEAVVEIRTTKPNKDILNIIEKIVPQECLEITCNYEPILNNNISFIEKFRFNKIVVPYFTEMYFWAKKGKVIVFGPGDYEFAHSDEERIKKEDLVKGKKAYLDMIEAFTKKTV